MLTIGNLTLGVHPCIAVAIQSAVPPTEITAAAGDGVLVELRLDALADSSPDALRKFVRNYSDFTLLATIRHADEGGGWKGSESERWAAFEAVLPLVHAVDVEIASGSIAREVMLQAREAGRTTIGSFHDFNATPDQTRLELVHAQGRELGADIVKVAAHCHSIEDLQRLARFTLTYREENVIVIGMGEYGLASRVFFPHLGSLITYTFLGEPTAPGQLNCGDTLKYLEAFHPACGKSGPG